MISLKVDNLKGELNQQLYDDYINLIDVHSLTCTCGNHDNVIHGYYKRKVRTDKSNIEIRVVRVKCKCCGKTHAVLISLIIPYKSVCLNTSIRIIKKDNIDSLMIDNVGIDEQLIYRIRKVFNERYKRWMSLSRLTFDDDLVLKSFIDFKSNFLQVRKSPYNLIGDST